ncbi:calyx [Chrysodeixis includens nucleopolyhedrovirus]|uniref:Calyx n=1 Tax=Chrysodeixis includens nucleopolyhedrovirus TaxID=1207438 RepID=A0A1C8ZY14_9ABAC|nr:calyx [Chrysodeixis includens nucleopolyhedrovirus]AOL56693.1 calyx [Chrysodeixis includens nucleopolyhedrovirus]AOL56835.1 calyx [Chrysodeixis includens nucleopolyhedrovirus]AOL56977.1 calyx [Chrysodeixis includens nucleopolyhedrovirus]
MSLLSRKYQDVDIAAYLDQSYVLWVSTDDVLQILRLPVSVLQTIAPRHKKCWTDFRCPTQCRFDASKVFVDLYGLGNLCNRVNSSCSDYLMTLFVAEIYRDCLPRRRSSGCRPRRRSSGGRRRSSGGRRRSSGCRRRSSGGRRRSSGGRRRSSCWRPPHHHHHHNELLERISRQNEIILSTLNQLSLNNSNQHLELTNILNAIRLQNVAIAAQLTQLIETIDSQLGELTTDLRRLLNELDTRFAALTAALTNAIAQLQDSIRGDLIGINSILNNLTSSVTNINATLNNLLQAVNGLNIEGLSTLLNTILALLEEILGILTPEIPLNKRS